MFKNLFLAFINLYKMHTVASNKVSAKDRELAPRFYYKVSEKTTCGQKLRNALKMFLTLMFTQVGVIVLIGTLYCMLLMEFFHVETFTTLRKKILTIQQFFSRSVYGSGSLCISTHRARQLTGARNQGRKCIT